MSRKIEAWFHLIWFDVLLYFCLTHSQDAEDRNFSYIKMNVN